LSFKKNDPAPLGGLAVMGETNTEQLLGTGGTARRSAKQGYGINEQRADRSCVDLLGY